MAAVREVDWLQFLKDAWPFIIVGSPGAFAVWKAWSVNSDALRRDQHELIKVAQAAVGDVIHELRDEAVRLRKRLDEIEAELRSLQREHTRVISEKDAKITLLEGDKRQLEAQIAALERFIRAHGMEPPHPTPPYYEVAAGRGMPADMHTVEVKP